MVSFSLFLFQRGGPQSIAMPGHRWHLLLFLYPVPQGSSSAQAAPVGPNGAVSSQLLEAREQQCSSGSPLLTSPASEWQVNVISPLVSGEHCTINRKHLPTSSLRRSFTGKFCICFQNSTTHSGISLYWQRVAAVPGSVLGRSNMILQQVCLSVRTQEQLAFGTTHSFKYKVTHCWP